MAFDLVNKIKVLNPHANIDELYGVYNSIDEALATVVYDIREVGRTVAIKKEGSVVEYWFKDGIEDTNLIPKSNENKADIDASNIDDHLHIWQQKIDANYVHDQAQPSSIWTINHPLNKKVSVTITDTAGTVVEGRVTINDGNKVVIEFNFPFSGEAILN